MSRLKPLTKRTMTLIELQRRTVKVLRKARSQLRRTAWSIGPTDEEFIRDELETLIIDILQDRDILKMTKRGKK